MKPTKPTRPWIREHTESLLLALTLLATVIISALTLRQTTRHFRIERTSAFVARFNSAEMVALRDDVDRWLATKEPPKQLYDRALPAADDLDGRAALPDESTRRAQETISKLRTMANFFQEFGTALKADSLEVTHAHELLGAICVEYSASLEPFITETRDRRNRPSAYAEVSWLRTTMESLGSVRQ